MEGRTKGLSGVLLPALRPRMVRPGEGSGDGYLPPPQKDTDLFPGNDGSQRSSVSVPVSVPSPSRVESNESYPVWTSQCVCVTKRVGVSLYVYVCGCAGCTVNIHADCVVCLGCRCVVICVGRFTCCVLSCGIICWLCDWRRV